MVIQITKCDYKLDKHTIHETKQSAVEGFCIF